MSIEEKEGGVKMSNPIAIFGGSFNPPTNAHFLLAEQILNDTQVEKVLFVPVGDLYQKQGLLPSYHRVRMLQQVCEQEDRLEVSLVEVNHPSLLTTIDTLRLLQKEYPDHELWFVMGTDNLMDFPNWNDYDAILQEFYVLVMERGNESSIDEMINQDLILHRYENHILRLSQEIVTNCSSTIVRQRIQAGKKVNYLIPSSVRDYIARHQLYQENR